MAGGRDSDAKFIRNINRRNSVNSCAIDEFLNIVAYRVCFLFRRLVSPRSHNFQVMVKIGDLKTPHVHVAALFVLARPWPSEKTQVTPSVVWIVETRRSVA